MKAKLYCVMRWQELNKDEIKTIFARWTPRTHPKKANKKYQRWSGQDKGTNGPSPRWNLDTSQYNVINDVIRPESLLVTFSRNLLFSLKYLFLSVGNGHYVISLSFKLRWCRIHQCRILRDTRDTYIPACIRAIPGYSGSRDAGRSLRL